MESRRSRLQLDILGLLCSVVAWRIYPLNQNTGISDSFILFWKLISPPGSCSSVFLCDRDQEINVIRLQEKTRTAGGVELNEGCGEQLPRIFAAQQTSPALTPMDAPLANRWLRH